MLLLPPSVLKRPAYLPKTGTNASKEVDSKMDWHRVVLKATDSTGNLCKSIDLGPFYVESWSKRLSRRLVIETGIFRTQNNPQILPHIINNDKPARKVLTRLFLFLLWDGSH